MSNLTTLPTIIIFILFFTGLYLANLFLNGKFQVEEDDITILDKSEITTTIAKILKNSTSETTLSTSTKFVSNTTDSDSKNYEYESEEEIIIKIDDLFLPPQEVTTQRNVRAIKTRNIFHQSLELTNLPRIYISKSNYKLDPQLIENFRISLSDDASFDNNYSDTDQENSSLLSLEILGKRPLYVNFYPSRNFNYSTDSLIYIHIQKTGGTSFGKALINGLRHCVELTKTEFSDENGRQAESMKKHCYREESWDPTLPKYKNPKMKYDTWLISRLSTGWDCGVHASYTATRECLPKVLWKNLGSAEYNRLSNNLYFITSIRNPIDRFISEWKHYSRGAKWARPRRICGNKEYASELPTCFQKNSDWKNVTLTEFMNCRYNMGANRQVRMLANLGVEGKTSFSKCYENILPINTTSTAYKLRMEELLESAKANLEYNFSYFLLNEHRLLSQFLFEQTFGLKFDTKFFQKTSTRAKNLLYDQNVINKASYTRIYELNYYDIQLYKFAKQLFFRRILYFLDRLKEKKRKKSFS